MGKVSPVLYQLIKSDHFHGYTEFSLSVVYTRLTGHLASQISA